jgi:VanZ family protein
MPGSQTAGTMAASSRFARRSVFVRAAALAYGALVLVASLYPFSGWRAPAAEVLWARLGEWPRYYTWGDVALNVAGYAPLGLLLTLLLRARLAAVAAGTLALLACLALSSGVELLQGFVPARVTSALDVFCNGVGALLGAWVGLAAGEAWLLDGAPSRWRRERLVPGPAADLVLLLLALWLFTQFNPVPALFANGDLRAWNGAGLSDIAWSARLHMMVDAVVAALAVATVAGLCAWVMRSGALYATLVLVLAALALKSFAGMVLFNPPRPWNWMTPGAAIGLAIGLSAAWATVRLPPRRAALVALVAALAGAALINAMPANPYLEDMMQVWRHGHFWSFGGTTAVVASLWPFAAGAVILLARREREGR